VNVPQRRNMILGSRVWPFGVTWRYCPLVTWPLDSIWFKVRSPY